MLLYKCGKSKKKVRKKTFKNASLYLRRDNYSMEGYTEARKPKAKGRGMGRKLPATIDEAVRAIESNLTESQKNELRSCPDSEIGQYYFGLGKRIKSAFALDGENEALREACGLKSMHPDGASIVILKALHKRLKR